MAEVSERRVRPIEEAVSSQNWKQALQLCDKWHKKGEKSDHFLAIRAYVLAKQQDPASAKRGQEEITQLCHRNPAITDINTIYQIQAALKDLAISDDGERKLWERAAAAKPDDKDLAMTWLDVAIDRCDWQSAQKATMAIRKRSPKERKYEIWTVFMCYLIYKDPSVSEKERTMFGTLAYRMLSKAAEAVPTKEERLLGVGKGIQNSEELSLLIRVYLDTDHVDDARTLLMDSETLGPESAIFQLDHDLHRSLRLDVLEAAQDWSAVLKELQLATTASPSEKIQIGRMVKVLLAAEERTQDANFTQQMRECLGGGIQACPDSRDLRHAMLRVHQIDHAEGRCTADDLLKAFQAYFSMRCSQLTCFDEFRNVVGKLNPALQKRFVELAQDEGSRFSESVASSMTPVLNAVKMEYCFLISPSMSAMLVRGFVYKVIRKYDKFSHMDRCSGPSLAQLAVVACMTLFRAAQVEREKTNKSDLQHVSFLQTAFLLRHCLTRCRDDYPSLVVLSRVLTLLGAVSFSALIFQKLSVKNLQWENAGHLLITRLSTLHPQRSYGEEEMFDPLQTLDLAVTANVNSVRSVRRHIMAGLNHKSYINVIETVELRENLKRSFSKQLYELESGRIRGLRDLPGPETEPLWSGEEWTNPRIVVIGRPNAAAGSLADRRDYSFIPSFEHPSSRPFAYYLEAGRKPKEGWLRVMKICRAIADTMSMEYHESPPIQPTATPDLAAAVSQLPALLEASHDQLTPSEVKNCTLQSHLGSALLLLRSQHQPPTPSSPDSSNQAKNRPTFATSIQHMHTWLHDTLDHITHHPFQHCIHTRQSRPIAPSWQYLHAAFSTLESLQFIALFLALQSKSTNAKAKSKSKPKSKSKAKAPPAFAIPSEQHQAMLHLVWEIERRIHDSARAMKANLNGLGVLGRMIDAVFGRGGGGGGGGAGDDDEDDDSLALGEAGEAVESSRAFGRELENLPDAEPVAEAFCAGVKESWGDALEGVLAVVVRRWE